VKRKAAVRKGKLWEKAHPQEQEPPVDPRYAALVFFDPNAPPPPRADDPASYQQEPAALTAAPPVEPYSGKCSECGKRIYGMTPVEGHDWWCSWWESPEGKAEQPPF
jgi:hypothetical protein